MIRSPGQVQVKRPESSSRKRRFHGPSRCILHVGKAFDSAKGGICLVPTVPGPSSRNLHRRRIRATQSPACPLRSRNSSYIGDAPRMEMYSTRPSRVDTLEYTASHNWRLLSSSNPAFVYSGQGQRLPRDHWSFCQPPGSQGLRYSIPQPFRELVSCKSGYSQGCWQWQSPKSASSEFLCECARETDNNDCPPVESGCQGPARK